MGSRPSFSSILCHWRSVVFSGASLWEAEAVIRGQPRKKQKKESSVDGSFTSVIFPVRKPWTSRHADLSRGVVVGAPRLLCLSVCPQIFRRRLFVSRETREKCIRVRETGRKRSGVDTSTAPVLSLTHERSSRRPDTNDTIAQYGINGYCIMPRV